MAFVVVAGTLAHRRRSNMAVRVFFWYVGVQLVPGRFIRVCPTNNTSLGWRTSQNALPCRHHPRFSLLGHYANGDETRVLGTDVSLTFTSSITKHSIQPLPIKR